MPESLFTLLTEAAGRKELPSVIAYNRIDGPGSSLDLREFQQAIWRVVRPPLRNKESMEWTRGLPRTIGMTIDVGTRIQAEPFEPGRICVRSVEYGKEVSADVGFVPPNSEHWLLKILDIFNLDGVRFVLHNLRPGVQSSGLGGSATATTGTCILANELAGRPFSNTQLIALSSRLEQDLGVSITGTQEQANVIFGGIRDYIWFPWGLPGQPETGYGAAINSQILPPSRYAELRSRLAIFHSGRPRASTDVNSVWTQALQTVEGYRMHMEKPEVAYRFREALSHEDWAEVKKTITEYREIRTRLCPEYMDGSKEILGFAEARDCTAFPLGAGGGGSILLFGSDPEEMKLLRVDLSGVYREIQFEFRETGHELYNLPMREE